MQKAATAYLQTSVSTTSQGEILLMLYDGAIKFLRQAQEQIRQKDYAKKGILISKALDILAELEGSLNTQKGGDIATNLHKLYFFCQTKLLQANIKMDVDMVEDVIKILDGLRSAYQEVVKTNPKTTAPATPSHTTSHRPGAGNAASSLPSAQGAAASKASTTGTPVAAPDQPSLLSASFWMQQGQKAQQSQLGSKGNAPSSAAAARAGAAYGNKPAAQPGQQATPPAKGPAPRLTLANPQALPGEQPAAPAAASEQTTGQPTAPAPKVALPSPQEQSAAPNSSQGTANRLIGSKLYQKIAQTT